MTCVLGKVYGAHTLSVHHATPAPLALESAVCMHVCGQLYIPMHTQKLKVDTLSDLLIPFPHIGCSLNSELSDLGRVVASQPQPSSCLCPPPVLGL